MSADIRISTGLLDHPKTRKFERRIGCDAIKYLLRLFLWVGDNRSNGELSRLTDEDIEIVCHWDGEEGKLITALCEAGFLDGEEGSRSVHNWAKNQPWAVNRQRRIEAARENANLRWDRERERKIAQNKSIKKDIDALAAMQTACNPHANTNAPNPTQPNPTQPNTIAASEILSPLPVEVKVDKPKAKKHPSEGSEVWNAYSTAYFSRYGVEPVRNAKTNAICSQLVQRLGDDAKHVAAFYLSHNDQFYIKQSHALGPLLQVCEGLRTQWATGRKVTGVEARHEEKRDAATEQYHRLLDSLGGGK